jgi:S1-C subfamily serine protease
MESKDRTFAIVIVTGLIALLLGCCLGVMAGAVGGYFMARQAHNHAAEWITPNMPATPLLPRLPGTQGVVVQEVIADSPAEQAGVQVADIITEVDGTPINANHRLADVVAQYQPGERVEIKVWRLGTTKALQVTLGENPQDSTRPYLGVRYGDVPGQPDSPAPSD